MNPNAKRSAAAAITRRVVPPLEGDQLAQVKRAYQQLSAALGGRKKGPVQLSADGSEGVAVPREVYELFVAALERLSSGQALTLVPMTKELTTQEAADFLNVSRPFLVGLLEDGRMPFRKVGTHRRVRFEDVLRYRQADDQRREAIASQLSREAEALDLDY